MEIKKKNRIGFLKKLLAFAFSIQKHFVYFKHYNCPEERPLIFAMWHANQCTVYDIEDKGKTNILVSRSDDGEIIAHAVETLGFKTIRGSQNRNGHNKGGVRSTMQMLEKLKENENVAIMVDGPNGPAKTIKNGVIKVAKLSKRPIIPMTWYSADWSLLTLPSWDKFRIPFGPTRLVTLYGDPIYVPEDSTPENDAAIKVQLKEALEELDRIAPEKFKELWSKKKKN